MALKVVDNQRVVVTTTNATITTLLTIAVPTGSAIGGLIKIVVRDTTTTASSAFYMRQVLSTNTSGTAAIIGSVITLGTDVVAVALVTALVTISVTSGNLLIRGTGIAATTLEWQVDAYMNVN